MALIFHHRHIQQSTISKGRLQGTISNIVLYCKPLVIGPTANMSDECEERQYMYSTIICRIREVGFPNMVGLNRVNNITVLKFEINICGCGEISIQVIQ